MEQARQPSRGVMGPIMEDIAFIELEICSSESAIKDFLMPSLGFTSSEMEERDGRRHVIFGLPGATVIVTHNHRPVPFVDRHGDGIRDIAFRVPNVSTAFDEAVRRGAVPVMEPTLWTLGNRSIMRATVGGIGDVVHSFVHDDLSRPSLDGCLLKIDHVAMCLEGGTLDATVGYYERAFGFHVSHEESVETETSGMRSKVVESLNGRIRFPLQEPSISQTRGQIPTFLKSNCGPGVQHVAFLTDDILRAVQAMRQCGMEPLDAPGHYYDDLTLGSIDHQLTELRRSQVLVDRDSGGGYLLQVFTKSRHVRGTLFFELIQRRNARGFGSANIKALFQALERRI